MRLLTCLQTICLLAAGWCGTAEAGAGREDWLRRWRAEMALSASMRDDGRLDEAGRPLETALELVEEHAPGGIRHARSLDDLAYLHLLAGRYDRSADLYLSTVPMWEKLLGKEQPRLATSLQNLAVAYIHLERYDQAEPIILRALEIWNKALGPDRAETAGALETYESILRRTGRHAEADRLRTDTERP